MDFFPHFLNAVNSVFWVFQKLHCPQFQHFSLLTLCSIVFSFCYCCMLKSIINFICPKPCKQMEKMEKLLKESGEQLLKRESCQRIAKGFKWVPFHVYLSCFDLIDGGYLYIYIYIYIYIFIYKIMDKGWERG